MDFETTMAGFDMKTVELHRRVKIY